ncbi:MAG: hypothetical protein NVS3B24_10930 [Candidatus Dormibacteria bacterium]
MTDEELEAPAYLGRSFPKDADALTAPGKPGRVNTMPVLELISADSRRDLSLGYLVMLSLLLVLGALGYAGEHFWVLSGFCAVAGAGCSYGAFRRARRRVREEMALTLTEPATGKATGSRGS